LVGKEKISITRPTKIICYTDGLSELTDDNGNFLGASTVVKHFTNSRPISENIASLIDELDIRAGNPDLFDDVSILALEIP
ncbi:MAG: SpoIIE family protein phosphatase, partial [Bacteroidales bacterium]